MARKKSGLPGLSFSWRRATGLSAAKGKVSRKIGIPLTSSGREKKLGRAMGCVVPLFIGASIAIFSLIPSGVLSSEKQEMLFPVFDVDAICSRYREQVGNKGCLRSEQRNYDYLKLIWAETSEAIKNRCKILYDGPAKSNVAIAPYESWVQCIGMYQAPENLRQQGKFRY